MKKIIVVLLASGLVAACATQPKGGRELLAGVSYSWRVEIVPSSATDKGQRYPDRALRVVNQSDTAANAAIIVALAFLGSFQLPHAKENSRGTVVETVRHTVQEELIKGLALALDAWLMTRGTDTQYKNPLYVRPDTFSLVYGDADGGEILPYDLYLQTTVFRKPDSASWLAPFESVTCSDHYSDPKLTLAQWQADDHARVKARAVEHAAACIRKVEAEFGKLLAE